jgi:hypothetical protein
MQGRGLIDHDRGDCYRDAAKRMRAVDRPGLTCVRRQARGLTEKEVCAWETLYRRAAEFMATYPKNYSDEEIAMRDALRAVDDARASRGEVPPTSGDAIEGLGPEPGVLAPAASDAAPPPVPADQVAIPRAVLERLVEATCYAPNVRVERDIARGILQQAALRHEPARHDAEAARAAARRGGQS